MLAHVTWLSFGAGCQLRGGYLDPCALVLYSVSRSGPLRIDAAVMLWTATHLDLWAGLGNIAVAAVVRNGSRYGRRSGSPRLRNSCSTNWISPCPFRAGGRLALVGKNLRGSRAAALPASGLALDQPIVPSGDGTSNCSSLTGGHHVLPGQGVVAFRQRRTISAIKQDLVSRDVNYSSPPYSDESLNPTRCGSESRL